MLNRISQSRVARVATAVNERYGEDAGGYLAAAIAFFGFLSLFPLLLLGLSVIGFALAANPGLRQEVEVAVARSVPGLEAVVGRNLSALRDARAATGLIGLAGLLWTGTGVVGAGRNAVRIVFREGRPLGGLGRRAWLIGVTASLGLLGLVATALAAAATGIELEGPAGVAVRVASALAAFGLDLALFLITYRVLRRRPSSWGDLLPGAVFAAIGWGVLKLVGTWYATRTVEGSEAVYGTFAATIGVLVVLYLAARLFVYGAELNAVLLEEKGGGPVSRDDGGHAARSSRAGARHMSMAELVGAVAGDVGVLVKKEIELARQEITEGISGKAKGAAALAAAGVMALFVLGFLGAAGVAALSLVLPVWAACLIVAAIFVVLAAVAAVLGRGRMRASVSPEKAKRTIKEDVEWARAQLRR